jgi:hypothetical protein
MCNHDYVRSWLLVDTHAVDLLLRGVDISSVARMLGDTVKTVMEHYLPFVAELREHARLIVDRGDGIERF